MSLLIILKRHLLVFGTVLGFWLGLILLDTVLNLSGLLSGILYWLSLIVLYVTLWYLNVPTVRSIRNEWGRFLGLFVLTTLITTLFMGTGLMIGIKFKTLIGG